MEVKLKILAWKIIFLLLTLIASYALADRFAFLMFREKTEAKILSLSKSNNESNLIVELIFNTRNGLVRKNKEINYSFIEDFKNKSNVQIFYNVKSPKSIYFVNYGPTIYSDIIIILIPCLLFIFGFIRALKH